MVTTSSFLNIKWSKCKFTAMCISWREAWPSVWESWKPLSDWNVKPNRHKRGRSCRSCFGVCVSECKIRRVSACMCYFCRASHINSDKQSIPIKARGRRHKGLRSVQSHFPSKRKQNRWLWFFRKQPLGGTGVSWKGEVERRWTDSKWVQKVQQQIIVKALDEEEVSGGGGGH